MNQPTHFGRFWIRDIVVTWIFCSGLLMGKVLFASNKQDINKNPAAQSASPLNWIWARSAGSSGGGSPWKIAIDSSRNVYVAGWFGGSITFGSTTLTSAGDWDVFVCKYDPNGNVIWAKRFGGNAREESESITADKDNNIYISGYFEGTTHFDSFSATSKGDRDIFIAKCDSNGNVLWFTSAGGSGYDEAHGVSLDLAGNVYTTGLFTQTATFGSITLSSQGNQDAFVMKCNQLGNILWVTQLGGNGDPPGYGFNQGDRGLELIVENVGNTYVTGQFNGVSYFGNITLTSAGQQDEFVAKLNPSGNVLWAVRGGGTNGDFGQAITLDGPQQSVYATGYFDGNSATFGSITLTGQGSNDAYLEKLDTSGKILWVDDAGGSNDDYGLGVANDTLGNCYMTGAYSSNPATFGTTNVFSKGGLDIFVAEYNSLGSIDTVIVTGSGHDDLGHDIQSDGRGNLYVAGFFSDVVSFGTSTVTSNGGENTFIAKLSADTSALHLSHITTAGAGEFPVILCDSSSDSSVTIYNDGAGKLYVDSLYLTSNIEGFSITNAWKFPFIISPGGDTVVRIHLAPATLGNKSAQLVIEDSNATEKSDTVLLSGKRETSGLASPPLNFGALQPAQFPATDKFTVRNTGTVSIVITSANFTLNAPFTIVSGVPVTLLPGDSSQIAVQFAEPGNDSNYTRHLVLTYAPGCTADTVTVSGSENSGTISVTASPFAPLLCDSSENDTVLIRNLGATNLIIDSMYIANDNEGFSLFSSLTLPLTLLPGRDTAVIIRFAPQTIGNQTGDFVVLSNAQNNSSLSIHLSAVKGVASISATQVNFGALQPAQFPATDTVYLPNIGTVPITITGANFTTPVPFTIVTQLPETIAPGDTGRLLLQFSKPGNDSTYSGTLNIIDTPHCTPLTTKVSGAMQTKPPVISSSQQQMFASLLCGTELLDTVYVHNIGTGTLDISTTTFSNALLGYTLLSPQPPPVMINPGDSTPFIVQFSPSRTGSLMDTLNLFNNDTITTHNPWKIIFTGYKDSAGFTVNMPIVNDFGTLCNGAIIDTSVTIVNTGSLPIGVVLTAQPPIKPSQTSWTIDTTKRTASVQFTFAPGASGNYTDTLTFTDTICHHTEQYIVHARVATPKINATPLIIASALCATLDTTIIITNPTPDTETVTSAAFSDSRFTFLNAQLPLTLLPESSDTLRIQFAASDTSAISGSLTLSSEPCNLTTMIPLGGAVSRISASISLLTDTGRAGDTVFIPIIIKSLQKQTQLNGITYQARVSYNGTILLPVGMLHGTIDTIGNGYVVFTGTNAADTAILKCIVGLGDSVSTALHIDTVNWGGCVVQSASVDGTFSLTGLCTQGGTRLYDENGSISLSQNNPNPFIGVTEIDYSTIEDGQTRLWITDVLGRKVTVLVEGTYKAGKYTARFDATGLSAGVYYYILQTPTQLLRNVMSVEK